VLPKDVLFIIHDTAGRDSRQELLDSARQVSVHYLVGRYDNLPSPVVIKYMSEFKSYSNGAGYGSLGGVTNGINPNAVQFELEFGTKDVDTIDAFCATVGQSMRVWRDIASNIILLPHRTVDKRRVDPRLDWNNFCERVYEYSYKL
jgi:N-acetyl-anhydromuramyl-L-alanine amidase AmpD